MIDAILREPPKDLDGLGVSGKLKALLRKLLEKDREKRSPKASVLLEDLKDLEGSLAPGRFRFSTRAKVAITAVLLLGVAAGTLLWRRAARERWVLEVASPEIQRLADDSKYAEAAALAKQARAILPNDPTLERLWLRCTNVVKIETVPAGAEVAVRVHGKGADAHWQVLGATPLTDVRIGMTDYEVRISKAGYAPWTVLDFPPMEWVKLRLFRESEVPAGMVPVSGNDVGLGWPLNGLPGKTIDYFFIDRYEVTNADYKKFVDAGGYRRPEYWREPFIDQAEGSTLIGRCGRFRDSTGRPGPSTWEAGTFPSGRERRPVAGVSWYEAAAYARFAGKDLPGAYHWTGASENFAFGTIARGSNFEGNDAREVGSAEAMSGFGTFDMAGNLKEWCRNEGRAGKRFILGGGFGEPFYQFVNVDEQSPWDRRPNFGFRCARYPSAPPAELFAKLRAPFRDFSKEAPVSASVFEAYRGLFVYDRSDLSPRVEATHPAEAWIEEVVSIAAAYGNERVPVHLFLPRGFKPPYQTVIYYPGANGYWVDKFDASIFENVWNFLPGTGRAVVYPVYRGMFERGDPMKDGGPPAARRDRRIMQIKDLGRTLDYLATRPDIDTSKLAYLGLSAGAALAPLFLTVGSHFKAAVLTSGGFFFGQIPPETDPFNFVTRVETPVLMLGGRWDTSCPIDSSQQPFFSVSEPRAPTRSSWSSTPGTRICPIEKR